MSHQREWDGPGRNRRAEAPNPARNLFFVLANRRRADAGNHSSAPQPFQRLCAGPPLPSRRGGQECLSDHIILVPEQQHEYHRDATPYPQHVDGHHSSMDQCYSIHWCIFISHDRISMRALKRGQKSRCNEELPFARSSWARTDGHGVFDQAYLSASHWLGHPRSPEIRLDLSCTPSGDLSGLEP